VVGVVASTAGDWGFSRTSICMVLALLAGLGELVDEVEEAAAAAAAAEAAAMVWRRLAVGVTLHGAAVGVACSCLMLL